MTVFFMAARTAASSYSIIGGADGPTSIFLAGKTGGGADFISFFGLALLVLLMIPNIVFGIFHKDGEKHCQSRIVSIPEQMGRYGCMLFMVFQIGARGAGNLYVPMLFVYLFGNILLMIVYWTLWMFYFNRQSQVTAILLAVVPTLIFLLCGIARGHYLLVGFAVLFGICHIYITAGRAQEDKAA